MGDILLADGFEEAEALVTADLLRRGGCEVTLVGLDGLTVTVPFGVEGTETVLPEEGAAARRVMETSQEALSPL